MKFEPAQARRNITIRFIDKDFSKFSVFPVIASYLIDYLKLEERFDIVLKTKSNNFSFSVQEYLLTLTTIIFLGIKRLYKADDLLANEQQLAKILGFRKQKFPSARALYLLLSSVDHWSVKRLDKVNFDLIKKHKDLLTAGKRWLTVDIDQTKKITEGAKIEKAKPCYHPQKKGRLGLRISAGAVGGLLFFQKLEPGNVGTAEAFEELITKIISHLDELYPGRKNRKAGKRLCAKRIVLRIDGGYFSEKTLRIIEKLGRGRKLDFILRAKVNLKLVAQKEKEHKAKDWTKINENVSVLRLSNQPVLEKHPKPYTVLVIKEKQKKIVSRKKRIYHTKKKIKYVFVANIKNWSTKRIIKYYKKRQTIENVFKNHNQTFKANKLPTHKFWGNAFYFMMVSLVSNISFVNWNIKMCMFGK